MSFVSSFLSTFCMVAYLMYLSCLMYSAIVYDVPSFLQSNSLFVDDCWISVVQLFPFKPEIRMVVALSGTRDIHMWKWPSPGHLPLYPYDRTAMEGHPHYIFSLPRSDVCHNCCQLPWSCSRTCRLTHFRQASFAKILMALNAFSLFISSPLSLFSFLCPHAFRGSSLEARKRQRN